MVWRRTEKGRWQPVNVDGTSHHATCSEVEVFRRWARRRRVQEAGALLAQGRLL
jgi:hypothetical protein